MSNLKNHSLAVTVTCALLMLAGCKEEAGKKAKPEKAADAAESADPQVLALDDSQMAIQKIALGVPAPAAIKRHVTVPGEIALNAAKVARISPRFAGLVKEVRAELGDRVAAGQTLALIESNESMSAYELKAPFAGTVISRDLQAGEARTEADTAFVIADLSTVWAEFRAFPKDLAWIKRGKAVEVLGQDSTRATANVVFVAPTADPETRTILVRAALPNPQGTWRAGLLVQGRLLADSVTAQLTVPADAVQSFGGKTAVFVRGPKGIGPRAVEVGRSDGERVEIRAGLSLRDSLVVGNAYLIKSELEKASFSEDEGEEEDGDKD